MSHHTLFPSHCALCAYPENSTICGPHFGKSPSVTVSNGESPLKHSNCVHVLKHVQVPESYSATNPRGS